MAGADATLARLGKRRGLSGTILALATAAALSALLVDWTPRAGTRGLTVGDVARADVRASTPLEVLDEALTEEKRRQARDAVPAVFEHDVIIAREVLDRVATAFGGVRTFLQEQATLPPAPAAPGDATNPDDDGSPEEAGEPEPAVDPAALAVQLEQFVQTLGVELGETDLATLQMVGFSAAAERDVSELVRVAMSDFVVLSKEQIPARGGITLVRVEGRTEQEQALDSMARIRSLQEARKYVSETADEDFSDRPAHLRQACVNLASALIIPNLRYDASATVVRREAAANAVAPVIASFARGQIIVRSGDRLTDDQVRILEQMTASAASYRPLLHLLSLTALIALFLVLPVRFANRFISKFSRSFADLVAMASLLFLTGVGAAALHYIGVVFSEASQSLPITAWGYALPVAAGGILVRTLMNSETAVLWSLMAAVVGAAVFGDTGWLAVYLLLSSLSGAGGTGHASERGRVLRAGFVAALTNIALVVVLDMTRVTALDGDFNSTFLVTMLWHVLFALAGGLASGVLAVGLVPLFEALGFLTDSKLLELANLNHPLMREMIVKSPGTYHHSMVVGSLAEAGAEAIHANSMLVRVGAYFHDIGKMLKPGYFIENQRDQDNPHDRLSPSMSALVIHSHVKEGIELGRRYGLPEPIIDLIPQHHGTSKVGFFYNKAVQRADADKETVHEAAYRYPGPKPQTKEAGIMMLADGVEAATRSLSSHSEGAIRARVQKIVNSTIADSQLDECPLTLKDLSTISETFIQVLLGIHHHRIEYPQAPTPGRKGTPRGLPAGSITLEIPHNTPPPDGVHPLERAAAERRARHDPDALTVTGERARAALSRGKDKKKTTGARPSVSGPNPAPNAASSQKTPTLTPPAPVTSTPAGSPPAGSAPAAEAPGAPPEGDAPPRKRLATQPGRALPGLPLAPASSDEDEATTQSIPTEPDSAEPGREP